MNAQSLQQLIPGRAQALFEQGRIEDIEQPLMQLGYLAVSGKRARQRAIGQFRADCWAAGLLTDFAHDPLVTAPDELDGLELELLHRLVSLDGDFQFPALPLLQSTTLSSRILHYRLHLLGLWKGEIGAPMSRQSIKSLEKLQHWLALPASHLQAARLIGDIPLLIKTIHNSGILKRRIVCFSYQNRQLDEDLREELAEEDGEKDEELKMSKRERSLQNSLQQIDREISGREAALLNQYAQRSKSKKSRLKRIRGLMEQLLAEQNAQLQQSLQKEQAFCLAIQQASRAARRRQLEGQLKQLLQERKAYQGGRQKRLRHLQGRLKKLQSRVNGLRFRFKAKLKRSLDSRTYASLKKEVFQKQSPAYLKKLERDEVNQLLLRIIQIHQWMNGYYFGRLDSKVGNRTFGALVDLTEDLPNLRLKYVLTKLGDSTDGYWLLNAEYLFSRFAYYYRHDGTSITTAQLIQKYQQHFDEADPAMLNNSTKKALKSFNREVKQGLKLDGLKRFCYLGVRSLARSIGRVIGKIVFFVKKQIRCIANLFKNAIKLMYGAIREGLRKYGIGIVYLLATGQVTGLNVQTVDRLLAYFNFGNNRNDVSVDTELAESADPLAIRQARNRRFGIVLALKVLKWGLAIASGSVTWPRLALQIGFYFRRMIQKRRERLSLAIG